MAALCVGVTLGHGRVFSVALELDAPTTVTCSQLRWMQMAAEAMRLDFSTICRPRKRRQEGWLTKRIADYERIAGVP